MLSTEEQDAICKFQVCVQLHTIFYYYPYARSHPSEKIPIDSLPKLRSALNWYSFYIQKYYPSFFSSLEEGRQLLKKESDRVMSSKSYLLPGYLSTTAKKCAKQLFSSSSRHIDDIAQSIEGYLRSIPDVALSNSIREVAVNCGFSVVGDMIIRHFK